MICEINLIRYNTPIIFPSFQVWRFKCFWVELQLDHRPDDEFGNEKIWQMMMSENNSWTVKNRFWAIFLHHGVALSWVFCTMEWHYLGFLQESGSGRGFEWLLYVRRMATNQTSENKRNVSLSLKCTMSKVSKSSTQRRNKKLIGFWGLSDQGIWESK